MAVLTRKVALQMTHNAPLRTQTWTQTASHPAASTTTIFPTLVLPSRTHPNGQKNPIPRHRLIGTLGIETAQTAHTRLLARKTRLPSHPNVSPINSTPTPRTPTKEIQKLTLHLPRSNTPLFTAAFPPPHTSKHCAVATKHGCSKQVPHASETAYGFVAGAMGAKGVLSSGVVGGGGDWGVDSRGGLAGRESGVECVRRGSRRRRMRGVMVVVVGGSIVGRG